MRNDMRDSVDLFRACNFAGAWQDAVLPWFRRNAAPDMDGRTVNSAVIVPSHAYGQFLKMMLLESDIALFDVRFLTHADCWLALQRNLAPETKVADRPELHLFLSAAAARFPSNPIARSVAACPNMFRQALDSLAAAGWNADRLDNGALDEIGAAFDGLMRRAGFQTAQRTDSLLAGISGNHPPLFRDLLIVGFDGKHWPLFNLLTSAANLAGSATVCLFEPRVTAAQADEIWINSWEEKFGAAEIAAGNNTAHPFAALSEAMESGARCDADNIIIHIAETDHRQARAITFQALAFLAEKTCRRLGLVFTGPCPAAAETARLLAEYGVPHNDTLGRNIMPGPEEETWQAWIAFQNTGNVHDFVEYAGLVARSADEPERRFGDLARRLRTARDKLITDDVICLAFHAGLDLAPYGPVMPETARFSEFLDLTAQTLDAVRELGGAGRRRLIAERAGTLPEQWDEPIPRGVFLQWLQAATRNVRRESAPGGDNPYARVQIVSYDNAEWQTWTHLILAGQNQDSRPQGREDPPFLDRRLTRKLNLASLIQGSQGEGHVVARKGHGLLLGPSEKNALTKRQFYNIIESAEQKLCLTASASDETNPSRRWNPGDPLVRLYAAVFGAGLSDGAIDSLVRRTGEWIDRAPAVNRPVPGPARDPARAIRAFRARRDANSTFGEYEFGLNTPPVNRPVLSCTAWEQALRWPELVWLRFFLGVSDETWRREDMDWPKVIGLRVHSWLRSALSPGDARADTFNPLPDPARIRAGLAAARNRAASDAARSFRAVGNPVPDWWRALHVQAGASAGRLCDEVCRALGSGWTQGVCEWPLPPEAAIDTGENCAIPVAGRVDLLLARDLSGPYWIIDYKTGSAGQPTPAGIARGSGLQIVLYAMALESVGMRDVRLNIATPSGGLDEPEDSARFTSDNAVIDTLNVMGRMYRTCVFGMKGDPRQEFGFAMNYPMAMLRIDPAILELKWKRFMADTRK